MTPKLRITGQGTATKYAFSATGPVDPLPDTERSDSAADHEARGEIVGGVDTYEFSGVPTGFEAGYPWGLDLDLDMGYGYRDWRPTYLNAGRIELRATDGNATYLLRMPEPGMVIRDDDTESNDVIVNGPNTFGTGHSIGGDADSFEFWPPFGLEVVADNPAEWRIPDAEAPRLAEWTPVTVYVPEMNVE